VGLFDVVFGKKKLKAPAPTDKLFAMSTAQLTLSESLGLQSKGEAAIVFQPLSTADFKQILTDMEEVVSGTADETGTKIESRDDDFGYRWMVLRDPDFDDLVVGINAVSDALMVGGYGERILAAVFPFTEDGRPIYWIYNFKRGAYYPFVPAPGTQQRNSERELQLKAQIGAELPVEPELERWFPLWGAPV
jgi:PspA associated protein B